MGFHFRNSRYLIIILPFEWYVGRWLLIRLVKIDSKIVGNQQREKKGLYFQLFSCIYDNQMVDRNALTSVNSRARSASSHEKIIAWFLPYWRDRFQIRFKCPVRFIAILSSGRNDTNPETDAGEFCVKEAFAVDLSVALPPLMPLLLSSVTF